VYIYQGECAEQGDVSATEKCVRVVGSDGCAKEDECRCEERCCYEGGKEEG
jgi:hypothetical protein